MSRIDPAEFDRLAKRRQDARKVLADAEVKQREATVGVKMAESEVMKADIDFQDYVNQHAPLPLHQPSLTAKPRPAIDFPSPWPQKACPDGPHPAKDCNTLDVRDTPAGLLVIH